ncbi:hypothetical protein [Micromonospora sp. NPDC048830]
MVGVEAVAGRPPRGGAGTDAAYARWATPPLPLYGDDHERADFAP